MKDQLYSVPGEKTGKESVTMTFRLDSKVMQKLRSESDRQQTTLNAYINHVLRRYTEWDIFQPKVGMVTIPKKVVADMFARLSKDEIEKIAKGIGKNAVIDMSYFVEGKVDLESFLAWFEIRMKDWLVEVNHKVSGRTHTIIIPHDFGENWSLYYKIVLEGVFNELFVKRVEVKATDTLLAITFDE
jgi:hypothetical protein